MARAKEKNYVAQIKAIAVRPSMLKSYPKILVYARNKKGKSTFALSAGIEQTLVLDPEKGVETMRSRDPYVIPITKWEDMDLAWGALRTGTLSPKVLGLGKSADPFTWVAVDGLTRLNNMALRYVMKQAEEKNLDRRPGMVDRRDYNKSGELIKQMMLNFHALKMGVVYTAQERMITGSSGNDDDPDAEDEGVYYVPDLPAGARGAVNSIVDVIGRIYVVRAKFKKKGSAAMDLGDVITKPQRRMWIGINERYDTGFRSDYELPDFVKDPTIPKLTELMLNGQAAKK